MLSASLWAQNSTNISTSDITYWLGEGDNSAIVVMYWCNNFPAGLAVGYHWDGASTIGDMLETLNNDPRITITGIEDGWIGNYSYQDDVYNMHITVAGYLVYTINGNWSNMSINMTDPLNDGDVFEVQEWNQCSLPENIYPIPNPNAPDTLFDGLVGTPNCQAIHYQDEHILGWATGIELQLGYQDIANAETVVSHNMGDGLGAPTLNTYDCISLGDGGSATLTFDIPIENGDGYDFAVFENSLDGYFLELGVVEVSSDGEHFVRFPATSNTTNAKQVGTFDTALAVNINNLAGKYLIGWGTPFDLQELADAENLDINNVTHVRVIDVVGTLNPLYATRDRYGRLINDPYPTNFPTGGFDISGVAVLNGWKPASVSNYDVNSIKVFPNPCIDAVQIITEKSQNIELYNINGQLLSSFTSSNSIETLNLQSYQPGIYFIKIGNTMQKILKK